jgi:hypothetical protein
MSDKVNTLYPGGCAGLTKRPHLPLKRGGSLYVRSNP